MEKIEAYGKIKNLRKLSFNLGTYFNPKVLEPILTQKF